ncbi:XFP N-terminal domain-containing protein [Lentzea albidocapillata subsp. violacea]|uniref:XFP N-terminal domain-containing protein n=1 Tax=Lentzea albidocapillata subsp. violacea TaxID=128104 RepID=A0A1G8QBD9_9PSEU|nr:hypothetical protein [Lentzea albidocapillata]SDJ02021.1 XFP N-terminal domain-containing protein [Lentzea albidocapillata subsp. violacea]
MTTTQIRDTEAVDRYRRACDYAAAAMIYLKDNVLLRELSRQRCPHRTTPATADLGLAFPADDGHRARGVVQHGVAD